MALYAGGTLAVAWLGLVWLEASGPYLLPRSVLGGIGMLAYAAVAVALCCWAAVRGGWHWAAALAGVPMVLLVGLVMVGLVELFTARAVLAEVTLPDGRRLRLTQEPVPTDTVYGLWQPDGLRWRRALPEMALGYSEDGRFTEEPGLALSPDRQFLAVRRGGFWMDCIRVAPVLETCSPPAISWQSPAAAFAARSRRIAALAGLPAE
ncbi:hypothetical protein [Teichococcus aestuarii]|uniref:hypothetical protein n=1 Tax=Teichococcus aestuarii TaxID=568898 RepID=UPI0036094A41